MEFKYEYKSKTIFSDGIWKDQNIKGNEKLVLIYLIGHYNPKEGYAFPSINTMVTECGINKRTVIKVLSSLEEKGYIKKVQSPKIKTDKGVQYQNNKYFIKCAGYMCYKKNQKNNSPLEDQIPVAAETKEDKKVEEQQESTQDTYYTPAGNVEWQMDIQDYDLKNESTTNDSDEVKEVNIMFDSYKDLYELALINGMDSILSPTTRYGIVEYANAYGLVVPQ